MKDQVMLKVEVLEERIAPGAGINDDQPYNKANAQESSSSRSTPDNSKGGSKKAK